MATEESRSDTLQGSERLLSVRRALAVLEALAARPAGATPKELSAALGQHLSTSYRLLHTLVAAGYVVRGEDGLYRLGARIAYLHHGYLAALHPPPAALPLLHTLQLATGESASINQLEGDDVVTTAAVAGSRPDAISAGYIGFAAPAHLFAAGRVLLAWQPAARVEAYLARHAESGSSSLTRARPDLLRRQLETVRAEGYALDRGDGNPHICCVAAPVRDAAGEVAAALAAVAPCGRFRQEEPALIATVLAVCRAIGALPEATPWPDERDDPGPRDRQATVQAALAMVNEAMSRTS